MSVKAMAWVWEQDLPRDEKFILLAYADHADHDGSNIFPAISTIASKTGYHERSVQRITRKLEERGLLIPQGVSKYQTNYYCMPIGGGDKLPPPIPDKGVTIWQGGDTGVTGGVTKHTPGGDIAMSPEPSIKPSIKPSVITADPVSILFGASGLATFPADQLEWIEVVRSLVETHGESETAQAMKQAYTEWVNTKGKNGRTYKRTNLNWINWAQEILLGGSIAAPAKDPKNMTDEEWFAWKQSQAQQQDNSSQSAEVLKKLARGMTRS